jgi:hypothetical protein
MDKNYIDYYRDLAAKDPDQGDIILKGAALLHSLGPVNGMPDKNKLLELGHAYEDRQEPEIGRASCRERVS